MQACIYLGDYASAAAAEAKAAPLLWTTPTQFELAEYHFYAAIARAAACGRSAAEERPSHLEALAGHHQLLELWAKSCPATFANRAALVGAEIARLNGQPLNAERLYEEAIRSAREHGFVQNEGLANELAANFYAARGFETIADAYLRKARYCYRSLGRRGKGPAARTAPSTPTRASSPGLFHCHDRRACRTSGRRGGDQGLASRIGRDRSRQSSSKS